MSYGCRIQGASPVLVLAWLPPAPLPRAAPPATQHGKCLRRSARRHFPWVRRSGSVAVLVGPVVRRAGADGRGRGALVVRALNNEGHVVVEVRGHHIVVEVGGVLLVPLAVVDSVDQYLQKPHRRRGPGTVRRISTPARPVRGLHVLDDIDTAVPQVGEKCREGGDDALVEVTSVVHDDVERAVLFGHV